VGPEAAGVTKPTPDGPGAQRSTASGWRSFRQASTLTDGGRFLLDHFLGRFCNPFYCIRSEQDLYDGTMDRATAEPLSLADFDALKSGVDAPDDMQRQLGSFLADCLVDDFETDLRDALACSGSDLKNDLAAQSQAHPIRALNPFGPLLAPELQHHLMHVAAARCGRKLPPDDFMSTTTPGSEELPARRSKSEHETRYRQHIENLKTLRSVNKRTRINPAYSVLIVGAGPTGLIRAVSAMLQGLQTTVLESRPEDAAKRRQIVVIRSQTVIALLEKLGVIDFLLKEDLIFPLGRLQLEVSLAGLELAFQAILHNLADDEQSLVIHHETVIERIDLKDGLARVTARKSGQQSLSVSPHLIVIADGRHSPTSALLGISRRDQFHSHTGIIAIFRTDGRQLSRTGRMLGDLASKLNYVFHRHVSRKGANLLAGTILQVPGHHYLGLDLARDEELRLRAAIKRAESKQAGGTSQELQRLVRFWARYGFEAIRTQPIGTAPHSGGRPIDWLPLDPDLAMPIAVVSDRADVFAGHVGETFVMIEGDAQFTIHPGSAYGCAKAFLSARLFDFLLRARLSRPKERNAQMADLLFVYNAELMWRSCDIITRLFRVTV